MKLKEIEMDLPYKKNMDFIILMQNENNLSYDEAVKKDYEINWKNKRNNFRLMTRCITSMIDRIMKPISTMDFRKIIIECIDTCEISQPKNLLGVLVIQTYFDFESFMDLNDYNKKKMIVDTIVKCMNDQTNKNIFDATVIISSCKEIIEKNYINEWVWRETVLHNYRKVKLVILHDIEKLEIFMDFYEKDTLFKRKLVISTIPDEWVYSTFLGKFEWLSEDSVMLTAKNGEKFIEKFEL